MIRIILTKCGKSMTRSMLPMNELRRQYMRNALIGCGTNGPNGEYVEILNVIFVLTMPNQ